MTNYGSKIIGTGSGFPERVMHNREFELFLETSDEWIYTRSGIRTRRISDHRKGESTLTLSKQAAQEALKRADLQGSDLDLIVVGTVTPESIMPCTANYLQAELGAKKAFGFDLQAACSGFLFGLSVADNYVRSGTVQNALVIGVETLSTVMNWQDRGTCVLFGDGAGAVIIQRTLEEHRIIGTKLFTDGTQAGLLTMEAGYSKIPPWSAEYSADRAKIKMHGSEIFKLAVRNMLDASNALLAEHGLTAADVDFFLFHQANIRIVEMCMKALNVDKSRTWLNMEKYGNTSAATLPVCLDEAWRAGAVKPGSLVLMTTFGGGLTWASSLVRL